jgi:hypothetical protein
MQSKPGSRGTVLALDLDEDGSVGGREPILTAKLMDDDDADAIVRLCASCCGMVLAACKSLLGASSALFSPFASQHIWLYTHTRCGPCMW